MHKFRASEGGRGFQCSAREIIIDTPRLCSRWLLRIPSAVGDSPGFESSRTQRELARETRGRFAQHRIMERHVIGRRPSCLVGTDELLSARRNREEKARSWSGSVDWGGWKGRRAGGPPERGLVTRVEYESSGGREEERGGGERAPRVLRY